MSSSKKIASVVLGFAIVMAGCAVESDPSPGQSGSPLKASGCFTPTSGTYKGAVVCKGVGKCGTDTGHAFWGTEVLSNGPKNSTGHACCSNGDTCNGAKATTGRAFECTDLVMRHFRAMGAKYDIGNHIYTGTMCGANQYGGNPNFDVYTQGSHVPEPESGDVIVFHGHTVVVSSYDSATSKVWFYQQNAIWTDRTELLVEDHTRYANGTIEGRYGLGFHCLIRAKNVCSDIGEKTTAGCGGGATKTCQSNHQWSTCQVKSCSPKTCAQLGLACGPVSASDNCGKALSCGGCGAGATCDAGACKGAASGPYAKWWWTGTLQNGGRCAEPPSNVDGVALQMATCSKTNARQNWFMTKDRYLENYGSDECVQPDATESGAAVRQQSCDGSDQIWRFRNEEVVNGNTGYCLDVPAADYGAGKHLIQWPCHGAANQRFDYRPRTGELRVDGWCVDAGSAAKGTKVTLQVCDGSAGQRWDDGRGGFVSAVATATPRCLSLDGGADAGASASVVVGNCDDTVEQMWALRGRVQHFDQSRCLSRDGAALDVATCSSSDEAQQFTFWMNL